MADTVIETLLYRIEADTKELRGELARAEQSAQKAGNKIGGSMEKAASRSSAATSKMSTGMSSLGRTVAGAAAAYVSFQAVLGGGRAFISAADAANRMENRLKLVTSSSEELANVQERLYRLAQDSLAPIQGTVELYTRVALASKTLGTTQKEVLGLTEAVNKAIALSGSTAQEAHAGMIQFAQGLASGRLQGDELRSVLENLPRLGKAIADGLGITIGQLREFGAEGKLVPKEIVDALLRELPKISEEFKSITPTVEASLIRLQNAFIRFAKSIDTFSGATDYINSVLQKHIMQLNRAAEYFDKLSNNTQSLTDRQKELIATIERLTSGDLRIENTMFGGDKLKSAREELEKINAELAMSQQADFGDIEAKMFDAAAVKKPEVSIDPKVAEASQKLLMQLREETLRINGDIEAAERASSERRIEQIRKQVEAGKITKEAGAQAEIEIQKQLNAKLKQIDDERLKDIKAKREAEVEERIAGIKRIQEANNKIAEEAARAAEEIQSDFRRTTESISFNFLEAARNGASAMDLLRQVANDVLTEINRNIAKTIAQMAFPEGGGGGGGFLSGILGAFSGFGGGASPAMGGGGSYVIAAPGGSFAKGGAFDGGVQKYAKGGAFTNNVVHMPTKFKAAKGMGLMGEAGPEAVMPLARTPDGKLGVEAVGSSGGGMTVFIDARGADQAAIARLENGLNALNASIERRSVDSVMKTQLRGGNFSRAFG